MNDDILEKLICHTIFNFCPQFSLQIRKTKANLANFAIDTSNQKATEDRITRMIMTVVGIFVACNSFQFANNVYHAFIGPSYVMFVLAYFVGTVNSSVNSVVVLIPGLFPFDLSPVSSRSAGSL